MHSNVRSYELANQVEVSTETWDCDILSVMADKIALYNDWTEAPVSPHFEQPKRQYKRLDDLLRTDLQFYAQHVNAVAAVADDIDIVQYKSPLPSASILIDDDHQRRPVIGVSTNFIKYTHVYLSKFSTLSQATRTSNLHESFVALAESETWSDETIYLSVLRDAIEYNTLDYEARIAQFQYLHEPYDYCELNIAIRRFALLHEVAHYVVHRNRERFAIVDAAHEEFISDELAYVWMMRPFLAKDELSETDKYELAMHMQGPMFFFLTQFLPFAIHHWQADKDAVLVKKRKAHYRTHPLRREMNLVAGLCDAPMFERMPKLFECMIGYLQRDVLAYDYRVFLIQRFGSFFHLKLMQDDPELSVALRTISAAVSDAFYAYSAWEEAIVQNQDVTLYWLFARYVRQRKIDHNLSDTDVALLSRQCYEIHARRMGLFRHTKMPSALLAMHASVFGKTPCRAYDLHSLLVERLQGAHDD